MNNTKYNLFENILREADKSRFLEPIYNRYAHLYAGIPTYESLLNFVNSNDPLMKGFDWQQLFKSFKDGNDELAQSYFDSIINKFQKRWNEKEKKSEEKLARHNGDIESVIKLNGFNVANGGDCSNADFAVLKQLENDRFSFIVPLNWKAAQFCNSYKCGGANAKWCLGLSDRDTYWKGYTEQGNLFILAIKKSSNNEEDTVKYMIQISAIPDETKAVPQDDNIANAIPIEQFKSFFGCSAVEMVKAFVPAILSSETDYNLGRLYFTDDESQPNIPWTAEELEGEY